MRIQLGASGLSARGLVASLQGMKNSDGGTARAEKLAISHLEQGFWGGGPDFYREHLTPDAKMLFPEPVGMFVRDEVIDSIDESPRWAGVEMNERFRVSVHADVELLACYARAWREVDDDVYLAQVVSVYRAVEEKWLLVYHQQVPASET